jgi:hypothetical protein
LAVTRNFEASELVAQQEGQEPIVGVLPAAKVFGDCGRWGIVENAKQRGQIAGADERG